MSDTASARVAAAGLNTPVLPDDGLAGTLIGRVWLDGPQAGPAVVVLRADGVFDLSARFATVSDLLEQADPVAAVRATPGHRVCSVETLIERSLDEHASGLRLLAPCDLQVVKAAGVTFATSLIERVIEEQARGDASRAHALREQVTALIGERLSDKIGRAHV